MDHDHDISPGFQCEAITSLLVGAVSFVDVMDVHLHTFESLCHSNGIVAAAVIDHDDVIDQLLFADFGVGLAQGPGRIVSGHDDDDLFISIHLEIPNSRSGWAGGNQAAVSVTSSIVQPAGPWCGYID